MPTERPRGRPRKLETPKEAREDPVFSRAWENEVARLPRGRVPNMSNPRLVRLLEAHRRWVEARRLHEQEGLKPRAIGRQLGVSHKRVEGWILRGSRPKEVADLLQSRAGEPMELPFTSDTAYLTAHFLKGTLGGSKSRGLIAYHAHPFIGEIHAALDNLGIPHEVLGTTGVAGRPYTRTGLPYRDAFLRLVGPAREVPLQRLDGEEKIRRFLQGICSTGTVHKNVPEFMVRLKRATRKSVLLFPRIGIFPDIYRVRGSHDLVLRFGGPEARELAISGILSLEKERDLREKLRKREEAQTQHPSVAQVDTALRLARQRNRPISIAQAARTASVSVTSLRNWLAGKDPARSAVRYARHFNLARQYGYGKHPFPFKEALALGAAELKKRK